MPLSLSREQKCDGFDRVTRHQEPPHECRAHPEERDGAFIEPLPCQFAQTRPRLSVLARYFLIADE